MHPLPATSSSSASFLSPAHSHSLSSNTTSPLSRSSSSSTAVAGPSSVMSSSAVPSLWSRLSGSSLLAHLDSLYVAVSSVGQLPPVCEQIHLGVVDAAQFRVLMEMLHTVGRQCQEWEASTDSSIGSKGQDGPLDDARSAAAAAPSAASGATAEGSEVSSSSDGSSTPPLSSLSPSSGSSQALSPAVATVQLCPPSQSAAHDALILLPPSSSSAASSSPSTAASSAGTPRMRGARSSVLSPPPPPASSSSSASSSASPTRADGAAIGVERDRFCKPSRLITVYPSKPFLITPIHLERMYVTSRKAAESMSEEEKGELATITVRWMGKPTADELFLVATDVCALINIRKSNTAKTVAQFADGEKVSMPVHCSSGKGSSTHILTVLTLAGVRRLLTTSRSVLATSLLEYLTRIAVHLQHFPHFVPVNDPTKPTVTPLKPEQHSQLVPNPAANGLSVNSLPPPPPAASLSAIAQSTSPTEPSAAFSSLSYPPSDPHSGVCSSSAGSTFLDHVTAAAPSSSALDAPQPSERSSGTGGVSSHNGSSGSCSDSNISSSSSSSLTGSLLLPLPLPLPASVTESLPSSRIVEYPVSLAAPIPLTAASGVCWPVKREYDDVDSAANGQFGAKKRKADDSSREDGAHNSQTAQQQQQPQRHQQQRPDKSPSPLPLLDESHSAHYTPMVPHQHPQQQHPLHLAISSGPQSPPAPDSPYSHFHPSSGLLLPPLHYTHSPPFMSTQPPPLPFSEQADMSYAAGGPYHAAPFYHTAALQQHHSYYLSPQHRPLTAPPTPIPPFGHYALTSHKQQQTDEYPIRAALHSPAPPAAPSTSNGSGNGAQHATAASGELALPPPLYPPSMQHTHSASAAQCAHCQHSQSPHLMYGSAVRGMSSTPPPMPQQLPPPPYHAAPNNYTMLHTAPPTQPPRSAHPHSHPHTQPYPHPHSHSHSHSHYYPPTRQLQHWT